VRPGVRADVIDDGHGHGSFLQGTIFLGLPMHGQCDKPAATSTKLVRLGG
jgi:hypothetical protein